MKDVSKMEGKTSFSRRLKQFDDLTWQRPSWRWQWPVTYFISNISLDADPL